MHGRALGSNQDIYIAIKQDNISEVSPLFQKMSDIEKNYGTYSSSDNKSTPTSWARIKSYFGWPSFGSVVNGVTSAIFAIPYIYYTAQLYSGIQTKNLTLEKLLSLSLSDQVLIDFMIVFTYGISVFVHYKYFPETWEQLVNIFSEWKNKIFVNSTTSILTIAAMISAFGLGYDAMIAEGVLPAVLNALLNAGLFGAFRVVFVPSFIDRVKKIFDADDNFKTICADYLERFKFPEHLNEYLRDKQLNKQMVKSVLLTLDQEIKALGPDEMLNTLTLLNRVFHATGKSFDIALGASLFSAYFLFNTQTGYRGMEVICELLSDHCPLDALNHLYKSLIGLASGLSSGMFAFVLGFDLRKAFQATFDYLKTQPYVLLNATMFMAIVLSSWADIGFIVSPAYNMVVDPNNIIYISMDNISGPLFIAACALFSFQLDYAAMAALYFTKTKKADVSPQVVDVIDWIQNNKESTKLMHKLNKVGLFRENKSTSLQVLQHEQRRLLRV